MQNDCEIYVDPEEDEVFFGCVSEREKNFGRLGKYAGSSPKNEYKLNKVLDEYKVLNVEENIENIPNNEQSAKISKEIFINDSTDFVIVHNELSNSLEKNQNANKILSNGAPVESEHNYTASPLKQKIDKSILATPKSVVKADKDGGFLKVLSEIALVKAEAEGDNMERTKENEDKENKVIYQVPEIKITEATPDKGAASSISKSAKAELRRFRNIQNSPRNGNIVDHKAKPFVESFESEKNFKNKCLDQDIDKGGDKRKSIDLIDLNDFEPDILNVSILLDDEETEFHPKKADEDNVVILQDQKRVYDVITASELFKPAVNEKPSADVKSPSIIDLQPPDSSWKVSNPSVNIRFSKEAKKVVEVLKKSAADDTLNMTIPEINVEEEENSFLSPKRPSALDETVIPNNNVGTHPEKSFPEVLAKPADNKLAMKSRTVEKCKLDLTPVATQSKLRSMRFFSERKFYNQNKCETKEKCARKLPMEEKKPTAAEKTKGGKIESNAIFSSRIPVFDVKNSKIPINERIARPLITSATKTQSGKNSKNSKFNHIESPINVYIHNKPTSLVCNVKPEIKKSNLCKVWKAQTVGSANKTQEGARKQNPNNAVKLPFVEYQSASLYKIEKPSESRLPRLAPAVAKLVAPHSPKVIKHEGRFYLNKQKKQTSTEETTIVAEPNEVSVVLSQPAQKSNTIK